MREISPDMRARLEAQATTLARAWRLTREDGMVMGFTDHDETLHFAGTRFAAATGLSAGEGESALGLSAGTQEVEGALSADAVKESDIAAGLYDGAKVERFLVDWSVPEEGHVLIDIATLGEVRRRDGAFVAELRGPEAALDRQRGRLYRRRCDAVLGDARCKADLAGGGRTRAGFVVEGAGRMVRIGGVGDVEGSQFAGGLLTLENGASREVSGVSQGVEDGEVRVSLLEPFAVKPEAGAAVTLVVGCDKSFQTCRARFSNHLNFRGFPHIPGSDAALGVAKQGDLHDGSPVVR